MAQNSNGLETLEKGNIYFFYRPRVEEEDPEGKGGPRAAGLNKDRQAEYPKNLQEVFRGRKFADADPPDFLNHEGTELLLIGASGIPKRNSASP